MKILGLTRTTLVALVTALALTGSQGCASKPKPQAGGEFGNAPGMGQGGW